MKDVIIKIYKDSSVYAETSALGINYENLQGKLVFKFIDEFVDGIAYLEFERKFEKGLIPMNKVGETYEIEIKSSLLKEMGNIDLQLRITQNDVPNGIPVYKSKVFTLEVLDAINATSEIPDDYPEWIDLANEKIKEMDNLNITTERIEGGVDIVLTDKKGNTTRTEVKDGATGEKGSKGDAGEPGVGVPIGGETGQILQKRSNLDYDTEWVNNSGGTGGVSDYETLDNKPKINGVELIGNKTNNDLNIIIPTVPTKISAFENDSGYIKKNTNELENYYDKMYIDNTIGNINSILATLATISEVNN